MKILISGSTSFLGQKLQCLALDSPYYFIPIERNKPVHQFNGRFHPLINYKKYEPFKDQVDAVLHLATLYPSRSNFNEQEVFFANFTYAIEVFRLAEQLNSPYFLNLNTILNSEVNYYAFSKNMFKDYVKTLPKKKVRVINLYLDMMFGFNDKRFFNSILEKLFINNEQIPMTSGNQIRNFVHVEEVVKQLFFVFENLHSMAEDIFIGSKIEMSLKDFVKIIVNQLFLLTHRNYEYRFKFGKLVDRVNERQAKIVAQKDFINQVSEANQPCDIEEQVNKEIKLFLNSKK